MTTEFKRVKLYIKLLKISLLHNLVSVYQCLKKTFWRRLNWYLTLFRMSFFEAAPKHLSHISYNDETWLSHTLTKEVPKAIWITWYTPWVLLEITKIFLYQEIQIQIPFRHIISNSLDFSWVLIDSFNKHGHNFDDVSKNCYPRPS